MAEIDKLLIEELRSESQEAWMRFVERFSGRLLAFVSRRVGDRSAADDIVQETLIGFIRSLPNFDETRPIDSFLYSICRYKISDYFRVSGRVNIPLSNLANESEQPRDLSARGPRVSAVARSGERRQAENDALTQVLSQEIQGLIEQENWIKLSCLELVFVSGTPNIKIAEALDLTQQQVASFKHEFMDKLKRKILGLGVNPDLFPELYNDQES